MQRLARGSGGRYDTRDLLKGLSTRRMCCGVGGTSEDAACPPPPPCSTNALSNKHFRSDRVFLGLNQLGTGFRSRIHWAPNGVSSEHSCSDRGFGGLYCSLDTGEEGRGRREGSIEAAGIL